MVRSINNSMTSAAPDPSEKAERILEGAMQEFLAHGYAATSMDRVAKTAGVSKATVYSYFQDKESLFAALVRRLAQQRFPGIFDRTILQGDPAEVLRHVATKALDREKDPEYMAFIRLIVGESGRFPELARIFVKNLAKPAIATLTQYLSTHSDYRDPEAIARILLGSVVYYLMLQELLHGREVVPFEKDRLVDSLVDLIVEKA
ncbi:MAG: TetR/AcrR family transcriptional regulator [Chloroflexaceae bacterium]|nr:TetR/AcrR family transcriptional regulator [Chloroflexaceae bacterium]